jgi:hypothetical protein
MAMIAVLLPESTGGLYPWLKIIATPIRGLSQNLRRSEARHLTADDSPLRPTSSPNVFEIRGAWDGPFALLPALLNLKP